MPDVDIDFFDRDKALKLFKHTPASMIKDDNIEKHKTGVYFHNIPVDPVSGHSTLDYKVAEQRGYFKIDCLNVSIYKAVESEEHLVKLMIEEPNWEMLKDKKIVDELFHLNGHYNIVSKLEPKKYRATCRSTGYDTTCKKISNVQKLERNIKRSLD